MDDYVRCEWCGRLVDWDTGFLHSYGSIKLCSEGCKTAYMNKDKAPAQEAVVQTETIVINNAQPAAPLPPKHVNSVTKDGRHFYGGEMSSLAVSKALIQVKTAGLFSKKAHIRIDIETLTNYSPWDTADLEVDVYFKAASGGKSYCMFACDINRIAAGGSASKFFVSSDFEKGEDNPPTGEYQVYFTVGELNKDGTYHETVPMYGSNITQFQTVKWIHL